MRLGQFTGALRVAMAYDELSQDGQEMIRVVADTALGQMSGAPALFRISTRLQGELSTFAGTRHKPMGGGRRTPCRKMTRRRRSSA